MTDHHSTNVEAAAYLAHEHGYSPDPDEPSSAELAEDDRELRGHYTACHRAGRPIYGQVDGEPVAECDRDEPF